MKYFAAYLTLSILLAFGCKGFLESPNDNLPEFMPMPTGSCAEKEFDYTEQKGCDGQTYPNPDSSLYVLPFPVGETYATGLTNCSSSFHAASEPDAYAFDFDMPLGSVFTAARSGVVFDVEESQPNEGGGNGNYVIVDHRDSTFALYLHAPSGGIDVEEGDVVRAGDRLGITGQSGLAGYPHLHFIVVKGSTKFPYSGLPITFRNVYPADAVLKGNSVYEACPF